MAKWVYLFREGNADMRNLLGGKGANLAEMTNLGLPIPPGFTVTTEACTDYYNHGRSISEEIQIQIFDALALLEEKLGKKFGDTENPLLVSVRSGARASMPGMMDTILNLGLTDISVEGFAKRTGNPRFAYDSYRRFIQMFSDVVMEVPKSLFERVIDEIKEDRKVHFDTELTAEDLKEVIRRFKEIYKEKMGEEFPQEPRVQLMEAVKAVFRSWDNERAIVYRRMNDIPGDWGTAVNVQSMVFGNMGNTSGTGVAFTRNPSTGAKGIYGEYLINAQGEDVVAGIRTPQPITRLEEDLPECYEEFLKIANRLEEHYRDMQDMEFTIEDGKLYFLQTRNGKRTAQAALQIACDLVDEGMITPQEAVSRIEAKSLDQLLHPAFDPDALKKGTVMGQALPASPGAAAGKIYFTAEEAKALSSNIKSGQLPFSLEQVEVRTVSATLGDEALSKAMTAGVIGLILVLIFMLLVYRILGLMADIALMGYVAIVFLILANLHINLTLPGIAGIILSVGMAVDANVVIFERVKEELKLGKTVRSAVDAGFNRALSAVVDSNVTTIISALILWWLGTGTIKGFGITLLIGIVVSMLSAIFITKFLLKQMIGMNVKNLWLYGISKKSESVESLKGGKA